MKNLFLLSVCLLISTALSSQILGDLYDIKLENKEDYKKHESAVIKSAIYVLGNPINEKNVDRQFALRFILQWMEGTPDHTFMMDEDFVNLTDGDANLTGLYLASMVKAAILSEEKPSSDKMKADAHELFIDYCANKNNNIKPNKAIKKMLKNR